jgi:hypothetical protein
MAAKNSSAPNKVKSTIPTLAKLNITFNSYLVFFGKIIEPMRRNNISSSVTDFAHPIAIKPKVTANADGIEKRD